MASVDKQGPSRQATRPWVSQDGGSENVRKAIRAARKVHSSIRLEFVTREGNLNVEGHHTSVSATVINGHLNEHYDGRRCEGSCGQSGSGA